MSDACREIAVDAGWRFKSLLRTRKFHTTNEIFQLYKSHILSFILSKTAGIHHASVSNLNCIDRVQRRFLSEIGVSERDALMMWNLAHIHCRRHIAIFDVLYRIAGRHSPDCICAMFPFKGPLQYAGDLRGLSRRHAWQFKEAIDIGGSRHTDAFGRSAVGLTNELNKLPDDVVSLHSVKVFQQRLQYAFRRRMHESSDVGDFFAGTKHVTVVHVQTYCE